MKPKKFSSISEFEDSRREANRNILSCASHLQKRKKYHESGLLLEIVKGLSSNMHDPDLEGKKEFGWKCESRLRGESGNKYPIIDSRYAELFEKFKTEVIKGEESVDKSWAGLGKECGYHEAKVLTHNEKENVLNEWEVFKNLRNQNHNEIFEDFFLFWVDEYTGKRNGDSNLEFHYCFGLNEKIGQAIRKWFRLRVTCGLMRQDIVPYKLSIFSPGTKQKGKGTRETCWEIRIDFYEDNKDLHEKLRTGDFILLHSDFNFSIEDLIESEEWIYAMDIDWDEENLKIRFKRFIELANKNPENDLIYQFFIEK
jgi:hypothetical protein